MDAFALTPPHWTQSAVHAREFNCPSCRASTLEAEQVWINRRAPVWTEDRQRKWQEFYQCHCGSTWWAWSNDRPPTHLKQPDLPDRPKNPWRDTNPFE